MIKEQRKLVCRQRECMHTHVCVDRESLCVGKGGGAMVNICDTESNQCCVEAPHPIMKQQGAVVQAAWHTYWCDTIMTHCCCVTFPCRRGCDR